MRWCQTLGQKADLIADLTIPPRDGAFARCPPWQLESAMQKATNFEHGGKVYEVRAIPTLNGWKVRIFVEGIPANGFGWPPKRLPTTISRRKTINSNHEV